MSGCARESAKTPDGPPQRVITLTPSLTEIVTALGAANRLVATDRYSIESGAAANLPVVGDFLAPNVEAISKLRPDLVILDTVQSKAASSLDGGGVRTLSIEMHSIADVKKAVAEVAAALGAEAEGTAVVAGIDAELARLRAVARARRPRVLWVIDRNPDRLVDVVAAGPGTYADELLAAVGADNILTDERVRYPKLSAESVSRLSFEIVIDASGTAQTSMAAWESRVSDGEIAEAVPPALAVPGPDLRTALAMVARIVARARP